LKTMPGVPSSEEVTAYLAAHKLEPVIEDAVNDAVLKQVKVRWPQAQRPRRPAS
jgi:predicted RNA polymerase sigma factor